MPKNQEVRYTFDQLNRLQSVTYGSGQKVMYTYDPAGNCTSVAVEHTGVVTPSITRLCPRCQRPVPAGKKFCSFDGTPIPDIVPVTPAQRLCPTCQRAVPVGKKFCAFDGTPVPDLGGASTPLVSPAARLCPTCQRPVPAGKKFCAFDGTRVL